MLVAFAAVFLFTKNVAQYIDKRSEIRAIRDKLFHDYNPETRGWDKSRCATASEMELFVEMPNSMFWLLAIATKKSPRCYSVSSSATV